MNAPVSDPRLDRIAVELDITVKRLQWMHAQLGEIRRSGATPVPPNQVPSNQVHLTPAPPNQVPLNPVPPALVPAATPRVAATAGSQARPTNRPLPQPPHAAWSPHPSSRPAPGGGPSAGAPYAARLRQSLTVARLLAAAGALVTLVGVALLLVLAAQAGFFEPPVRVALGGVLAVGLGGAALWLHGRPGGRIGSPALAATGFAAAYLDVLAVTSIYHWVHPAVGLALAGLIALAGLALAARWHSQWLGIALFAPVYPLAVPLVSDLRMLAGFALVLAIASLGVQRPAIWQWLHLVRAIGTSITLGVLVVGAGGTDHLIAMGAAVLGAAVGTLAAADPTARAGRSWPLVAGGLITVMPVLSAVPSTDLAIALAATAAVVAATVALGLLPETAPRVRATWFAAAAIAAAIGVYSAAPHVWASAIVLGLAAAALSVGGRDRAACWSAAALGLVGIVSAFAVFGATLVDLEAVSQERAGSIAALLTAVAALIFSVAAGWRSLPHTPEDQRAVVAVGVGILVLGSVTAVFANAGWALAGAEGLRWGHGIATVVWMITGATALFARRLQGGAVGTAAGLATIGAAVAKLFLFDLAALDGAIRVIAFLVVGVILLGVGATFAARSDRDGGAAK